MAYLFKQKLNLSDLAGLARDRKRILIYEPEEYLGTLYSHYLRTHNFDIKHCPDLKRLREYIITFEPDLLIFSLGLGDGFPKDFLTPNRLIKEFPNLKIISTGYNLSSQKIGELMATGVVSHINRRLSRPQDLALIVKTILQA